MVKPKQLGHLVLRVRDAERSKAFYTDLLGLHVTFESPASMVFMSAGESSHELALMALGPDAPGPDSSRVGMYHFAWEMESFEDLKRLKRELDEKDVRIVGIGDHGISMGDLLPRPGRQRDGGLLRASEGGVAQRRRPLRQNAFPARQP